MIEISPIPVSIMISCGSSTGGSSTVVPITFTDFEIFPLNTVVYPFNRRKRKNSKKRKEKIRHSRTHL